MRGIDSDEFDLRGAIEMGAGGRDRSSKSGKGGKGGPSFYGHDDPMGISEKKGKGRNLDDEYATNKSYGSNKIHPDKKLSNKIKNAEKVNWDFVDDKKGGDYDPFKKIDKGEYDEFQ